MLIDIHTHLKTSNAHIVLKDEIHSLGIHPWKLTLPYNEESIKNEFENLKRKYHQKILAIGECGLDRRKSNIATIDEQMKVLNWHLDWASIVSRPVIIHCVHAYSDLLNILKYKKYRGKILIHDFSGNLNEANSLMAYESYFSFGKRLFDERQKTSFVFQKLPKTRIFLETDDQNDISIAELYFKASELLNISQEDCESLFEENLKRFFGDLNDVSSSDAINFLSSRSRT